MSTIRNHPPSNVAGQYGQTTSATAQDVSPLAKPVGVLQPRSAASIRELFGGQGMDASNDPAASTLGDRLISNLQGQFKQWLSGTAPGTQPVGEPIAFENMLTHALTDTFKQSLGSSKPGNPASTTKPEDTPAAQPSGEPDEGGLMQSLIGQFREWLGLPGAEPNKKGVGQPQTLSESLRNILRELLGKNSTGTAWDAEQSGWNPGDHTPGANPTPRSPGMTGDNTDAGGHSYEGGGGSYGHERGGRSRRHIASGNHVGPSRDERILTNTGYHPRVMRMLDKAIKELEDALAALDSGAPQAQAIMDKHFGNGTQGKQQTKNEIRYDLNQALGVLNKHKQEGGKNITLYNANDGTGAHVYPDDRTQTIHVNESSIGASDDFMSRLLIHEAVHFGGAGDHWYGNLQQRGNPTKAKDNADTLAYAATELGRLGARIG